ncbi:MAG TPA: hypothetical protein VMS11_01800 [Solirubrobacterales bacterium]|nr:hypothetical protein [Solirubrobacterales bacterium]
MAIDRVPIPEFRRPQITSPQGSKPQARATEAAVPSRNSRRVDHMNKAAESAAIGSIGRAEISSIDMNS